MPSLLFVHRSLICSLYLSLLLKIILKCLKVLRSQTGFSLSQTGGSLSLTNWRLSLKDRCFTLSFAQINVSLLVGRFFDGSLSFCLVPPWWWWWLVVVEVVVSWWWVVGWVVDVLLKVTPIFPINHLNISKKKKKKIYHQKKHWFKTFFFSYFFGIIHFKLTNLVWYPKRNSHLYYFMLLQSFIFIF